MKSSGLNNAPDPYRKPNNIFRGSAEGETGWAPCGNGYQRRVQPSL